MLGLSQKRKNKYLNQARNEKDRRLIELGKKNHKDKIAEKEAKRVQRLKAKDHYENSNLGDFQNLYPVPKGILPEWDQLMEKYDHIYQNVSKKVYEESVIGAPI